jgi:hypothetical protein
MRRQAVATAAAHALTQGGLCGGAPRVFNLVRGRGTSAQHTARRRQNAQSPTATRASSGLAKHTTAHPPIRSPAQLERRPNLSSPALPRHLRACPRARRFASALTRAAGRGRAPWAAAAPATPRRPLVSPPVVWGVAPPGPRLPCRATPFRRRRPPRRAHGRQRRQRRLSSHRTPLTHASDVLLPALPRHSLTPQPTGGAAAPRRRARTTSRRWGAATRPTRACGRRRRGQSRSRSRSSSCP